MFCMNDVNQWSGGRKRCGPCGRKRTVGTEKIPTADEMGR